MLIATTVRVTAVAILLVDRALRRSMLKILPAKPGRETSRAERTIHLA
jgi:hypothetical protein